MNVLLDTNILLHIAKDTKHHLIKKIIEGDHVKVFVSIVTVGELKSIAIQNNWGEKKWTAINIVLQESVIVEINDNLVHTYAQIDAFSQCRNPSFDKGSIKTPRNMGKNDLWIASTAALLGLKLITTDADFDHLHDIFFDAERISPVDLK